MHALGGSLQVMVRLALGEISGLIQTSLIHQLPTTHQHLLSLMDCIPACLSSLPKLVIAYSFLWHH